jgi:hypothetical protein
MAKRKKAKGTAASGGEKIAFQMRFDRDLYTEVVGLAETTGISVNQLVQGICRGVIEQRHVGRWERAKLPGGDMLHTVSVGKGCVWFGVEGTQEDGETKDEGTFWFGIDIRDRGDVHHA